MLLKNTFMNKAKKILGKRCSAFETAKTPTIRLWEVYSSTTALNTTRMSFLERKECILMALNHSGASPKEDLLNSMALRKTSIYT